MYRPARILLQVPPRNATERPAVRQLTPAHVPMSEEVGEVLFSQGYDSDGLIAEYHPEQDLIELENYSKVEIGVCEADTVPELAPAIVASRFVLIADSELVGIPSANDKFIQVLLQIPRGDSRSIYVTLQVPKNDCSHMDAR